MPTLREFEQWLSTSQTAKRLGKSRQGALYLAEHRHIRACKTAIGWLFDPEDVERHIQGDRTHQTTHTGH